MSTERSGKIHIIAWTLTILAVPVLYILSVAPVTCFTHWRMGVDRWRGDPDWLQDYRVPYHWLDREIEGTRLQTLIYAYDNCWFQITGQRRDPFSWP